MKSTLACFLAISASGEDLVVSKAVLLSKAEAFLVDHPGHVAYAPLIVAEAFEELNQSRLNQWLESKMPGDAWFTKPSHDGVKSLLKIIDTTERFRMNHSSVTPELDTILSFPSKVLQVLAATGEPIILIGSMVGFCEKLINSLMTENRHCNRKFVQRTSELVKRKESLLKETYGLLTNSGEFEPEKYDPTLLWPILADFEQGKKDVEMQVILSQYY